MIKFLFAALLCYFYDPTDPRNREEENATGAGRSLQKVPSVLKPGPSVLNSLSSRRCLQHTIANTPLVLIWSCIQSTLFYHIDTSSPLYLLSCILLPFPKVKWAEVAAYVGTGWHGVPVLTHQCEFRW
jgi:hypothetical protein